MKTKMRRLMAIVMAMVMMIAMSTMVSADEITYPYLTVANGTDYTTVVDTTGTELSVQKYGSDWNVYPFASTSEVDSVVWSWPYGGGNNFTTYSLRTTTTGGYFATLDITAKSTATPGAYTVRATYNNSAYIDLTVVVPNSSNETASVTVEIDGLGSTNFTATNTVTAQAGAYKYATPVTAVNAMVGTTYGTSISSYQMNYSGEYISSITGFTNSSGSTLTKTEDWSTGLGWQYRVYHLSGTTYVRDDSTEILGPTAYKLTSGDYVKWVYCTYSDISSYFPESFAASN